MKELIVLASLLLACTGGCTGGDEAPSASVTMAAPDSLAPADDARDDLVITVEYADGDGDLGGGTARVHDCRGEGLTTELPIPAIAPDAVVDDGTPITGTLELHVNDIGAIAAGPVPTACRDLGVDEVGASAAVFCVILADAAGHDGDGDCTQSIALTAD